MTTPDSFRGLSRFVQSVMENFEPSTIASTYCKNDVEISKSDIEDMHVNMYLCMIAKMIFSILEASKNPKRPKDPFNTCAVDDIEIYQIDNNSQIEIKSQWMKDFEQNCNKHNLLADQNPAKSTRANRIAYIYAYASVVQKRMENTTSELSQEKSVATQRIRARLKRVQKIMNRIVTNTEGERVASVAQLGMRHINKHELYVDGLMELQHFATNTLPLDLQLRMALPTDMHKHVREKLVLSRQHFITLRSAIRTTTHPGEIPSEEELLRLASVWSGRHVVFKLASEKIANDEEWSDIPE